MALHIPPKGSWLAQRSRAARTQAGLHPTRSPLIVRPVKRPAPGGRTPSPSRLSTVPSQLVVRLEPRELDG